MKISQSIGVIVSSGSYEESKRYLEDRVEFIPGFPTLIDIANSLISKKTLGPAYAKLTPIQKQWLTQYTEPGGYQHCIFNSDGTTRYSEPSKPQMRIMVNQFNDTTAPIIAIELFKDDGHWSKKTTIEENCFEQPIRVINYAHDQGGKKVHRHKSYRLFLRR